MDHIEITRLTIQGSRTPYSQRFQDVYFAEDSGLEESRYVYLEGSGLEERIRQGSATLSVGEIGFGVGLNFLLTLRRFIDLAHPDQRLHYFSAEQFPVHAGDLETLYRLYPELAPHSNELLAQYPLLTPGVHSLSFLEGRVRLYLLLGSAERQFERVETPIDVWYWDGFAPSRNPDAFSESLFKVVAKRSAAGAGGASFTSAGWVRRGLEAAGFRIEKRPGFGRKRECIRGVFEGAPARSGLPAWFSGDKLRRARPGIDRIAVVGGGLAGSAVARTLASRGLDVDVFDPNGIAARASGNKAGLFNVQISRVPNPISRFAQASLSAFLQELRELPIRRRLGILRADSGDAAALAASEYPPDFFESRPDGLYLPQCGFLNPVELCRARIDHDKVRFRPEAWALARKVDYPHVVYAMGADLRIADSLSHPILDQLPVRPIRGQLLELRPTGDTRAIDSVRVHHAYLTPLDPTITGDEVHLLGATYQAKAIAPDQERIDRDFLLAEAKRSWPEFASVTSDQILASRVGFRLSTPDKLPLIGPLVDPEWLRRHYGRALKGTRAESLPPLEALDGEWCLLGLGSRGITYSSLGAELLACLMTGEPLPIESDLWEHLHSARFFIRNLRKNALD